MKKPAPNVNKVIAAYRMNGSLREAADALHLSFWKTRKILMDAGFSMKPRGGASHIGKKKHKSRSGTFAIWLRDHPDVRLPLDLDEIARITGCSKNAIKCSLYRLRKKGKKIPKLNRKRRATLSESAPKEARGTTARGPRPRRTSPSAEES